MGGVTEGAPDPQSDSAIFLANMGAFLAIAVDYRPDVIAFKHTCESVYIFTEVYKSIAFGRRVARTIWPPELGAMVCETNRVIERGLEPLFRRAGTNQQNCFFNISRVVFMDELH